MTLLNLVDGSRVSVHCFLFEIADKAVDNARRKDVRDEESVKEDALGADNHELHEPAGLAHLHKGQEVHALVVAFLE